MQGQDAEPGPITAFCWRGTNFGHALPRDVTDPLGAFADYATPIGRLAGAPLDPDEAPGYLSGPPPETLPHADRIAAIKHSFPAALRAN